MSLVNEKVINAGNEINNIKYLKNQNSMSKGNSKALKKKVALEKDDYEGDSNDESEDSGDQFGWKQSKNRSNKN